MELIFHEQISGAFEPFVDEVDLKLNWLRSHSLVTLLLIYSAFRKVFTILHDATLGTVARGVYLLRYGTQHQKERMKRLVALRHHCHQTFLVASQTRQSRPSLIAW